MLYSIYTDGPKMTNGKYLPNKIKKINIYVDREAAIKVLRSSAAVEVVESS